MKFRRRSSTVCVPDRRRRRLPAERVKLPAVYSITPLIEDEDDDEYENDRKAVNEASKVGSDPLLSGLDPGNKRDPAGHP